MKRSLSRDEAVLWARLAGTVKPIDPKRKPYREHSLLMGVVPLAEAPVVQGQGKLRRKGMGIDAMPAAPLPFPQAKRLHASPAVEGLGTRTLDANWDRKLGRGVVQPDFTIDLHGHSLDQAHSRLEHGLTLAASQGARLVLLITGRPRPGDAAGRGDRRGAIRAKFLDWLALGSHGGRIAAIRPAHQRHGGPGAVYLVLRKPR